MTLSTTLTLLTILILGLFPYWKCRNKIKNNNYDFVLDSAPIRISRVTVSLILFLFLLIVALYKEATEADTLKIWIPIVVSGVVSIILLGIPFWLLFRNSGETLQAPTGKNTITGFDKFMSKINSWQELFRNTVESLLFTFITSNQWISVLFTIVLVTVNLLRSLLPNHDINNYLPDASSICICWAISVTISFVLAVFYAIYLLIRAGKKTEFNTEEISDASIREKFNTAEIPM